MSSNRPLMNVNEDSEILFKLGILTSKAKSKRHFEGEQRNADNGTLSGTITDDEDSELDVLYDKQNLLKREPEQADKKQRHFSVQKVVPSISFFILGLLNVLVLVTIPEVATNVAKAESSATTSVSLLSLVVINGFGCVIGNYFTKRLLKRCNPLFLLILSTVCSIPFTLVIVWCVKLYSVYFYVFVLSILLGFIHEGGFIIIAIDGMSVRTLLLLHVFISGGSLVASAVCLLFVRDSNQLLVPLQQSSTVPVTPHYISDNVKRSLLQKPAAYSVFFNGSEESNGKKSELSTLWDTAPLASNVENGFTLIRPNSSSKNFKSDDAKFLFSSAVRKRFSKNESAIKNTNHLWYLWKGQVSNLTELKIAYGFVAVLAFSIMVFFVLPLYFCIGNSHFVKENERKSFGRLTIAHSRHNWQWLACILFFILSGVEGIFCVTVALCASYLFNSDNLLQMAYFTIFLFWAGSIVARFTLSSSSRLASSMQLMQFLLLITSVISCFGALFSQNSSIVALNVEIFLIGIFLSPVIPCVVGWLEKQHTSNWWTLCNQHCISISSGRTTLAVLAFVLCKNNSIQYTLAAVSFRYLFVIIACLTLGAFLILLLLTRYVRDVARVIAVEQLSETLMRTDREDSDIFSKQTENATGSMPQQHNNGYVQLSTGANIDSEDSLTGSDQEYENEL